MSKELIHFEKALSVGSLGSYIQWTNQIPLLSAEEEHQLAENLQQNGDLESARKLVLSHLRLVVKIARGYAGYGLQQADLIQEGSIGLMKAVKRFDPSVGVRLVSFAIHWIRAEMHEFILRNWRIVKVATTKAQRKLFFNLRKAAKKRGWFSHAEVDTIAEQLNVSHKDVSQMEQRLNAYDQSFDAPSVATDSDDIMEWSSPANTLEDAEANPALQIEHQDASLNQREQLKSALLELDQRSRDILVRRWLSDQKPTLHQLAEEYQVSAERIRQLEKNALNKLKGLMPKAA